MIFLIFGGFNLLVYALMTIATICFTKLYDLRTIRLEINCEKNWKINKEIFYTVSLIPSIIVSAIRFEVGTDFTEVYWAGYLGSVQHNEDPLIPKSYLFICKFLNLFSNNPVLFFFLSSFFILFSVFWYIKETNYTISLPIFLFFTTGLFFDSLNVVRQYMSISFWLLSYISANKNKYKLAVSLAVFGVFLHVTSVILIPLCFLRLVSLNRKKFVVFEFCSLLFCLFASLIMPFILIHIPKYQQYANWKPDPEIAGTIFAFLITAITLLNYNKIKINEHNNHLLWSLIFYDSCVFSSYLLPQMGRVMIYFEIPVFVNLITTILNTFKDSKHMCAVSVSLVFFSLSTLYMNYYLGQDDVIPYRAIIHIKNIDDYLGQVDDVIDLFRNDKAIK